MGLLSLHLRRARMEKVRKFVHGEVLDLRCGQATMKQYFGSQITTYAGVERDRIRIRELKQTYSECRFYARDLDTDCLDISEKFDVVLMIALAEHLFNQRHVFEQAAAVLKPSGRIVLTTPTPFGNDFVHPLGARLGLFAQSAVDDHIVVYNKRRLKILAKEIGLILHHYKRFQLGCNQLAVLKKPEAAE